MVELTDKAVELKTTLDGAQSPGVAKTLTLLGLQYYRTSDYQTAITTLERALAMEDSNPAVTALSLARTLNVLGQALAATDRTPQAVTLHQRSLALSQKEFGPLSREAAEVLGMLGDDSRVQGNLTAALDYLKQSVSVFEAAVGPDHLATTVAVGQLATIYKERGEFDTAIVLHRRAIANYERIMGPDHPRLVSQYNNLGLALKESGDPQAARVALEHALAISEKKLGPEASVTATVLGNLGIAMQEGGDFAGARQIYERALAIQEKRLGPEHQLVATLLNSLGLVLGDIGDYKAARVRIERAFAIYEKTLGLEYPKTLEVLANLANLLAKTGDNAAARTAFERAWQGNQAMFGDNNSHTAWALFALAKFELDSGDSVAAKTHFEQAIRAQEIALGPTHARVADSVNGLAEAAIRTGDYAGALPLFQRAASLWTNAYGPAYPTLTDALAGQANALAHLGRKPEAVRAALESAAIRRENVLAVMRDTGERQALLMAGKDREGLNIALRLAPQASAEDRRDIWNALIQERALVLDEMGRRHRTVSASRSPEVLALSTQVATARNLFANAVVAGPGDRAENYAARVQALRDSLETAERELARTSADFGRDLKSRRAGFAEVLAALPTQSALIGFARTGDDYMAFTIRGGEATPAAFSLGRAERIDAQVKAWRAQIDRERDSLGRASKQNEAAYRTAGIALRHSIWDPLVASVAGAKQVYIVPDGALQIVNFAALPTGQATYLVETGPILNLLSAERDLAAPTPTSHATQLLALGNPAFSASKPAGILISSSARYRGSRSACPGFAGMNFPDLPGSAEEAQSVAAIWRAQGMPATSLAGSRATEAALKEQAAGKRVIHLATHGFFLGRNCKTADELTENPLLRSGLALAGANHRTAAGPDEEDGILTAEEVASLDLSGVEWVVLSGCDTGLGEIQEGEGVLGLRRAFRVAGAQTLITSLWSVGDDDAREWMVSLYRARFANEASTANAVRSASTAQLRARRAAGKSTHPFYWAGFIAVGGR